MKVNFLRLFIVLTPLRLFDCYAARSRAAIIRLTDYASRRRAVPVVREAVALRARRDDGPRDVRAAGVR